MRFCHVLRSTTPNQRLLRDAAGGMPFKSKNQATIYSGSLFGIQNTFRMHSHIQDVAYITASRNKCGMNILQFNVLLLVWVCIKFRLLTTLMATKIQFIVLLKVASLTDLWSSIGNMRGEGASKMIIP